MKFSYANIVIWLASIVIFCLIVISCEKTSESGFSIEFSDGSVINEMDITFYDSSTCILFLENNLNLTYAHGEPPNRTLTEFAVLVDDDIIYEGIMYWDRFSILPRAPIYILSSTYPDINTNIILIKFQPLYPDPADVRNHPRIIKSLHYSKLLNHGITCSIDSADYSTKNDSTIICHITITNLDKVNYLIPDPAKMDPGHFAYYTRGLRLFDRVNNIGYDPYNSNVTGDWNRISLNDLSLLEGQSNVSFAIESSFRTSIPDGTYEFMIQYGNLYCLSTFDLELNQGTDRVWVGECQSAKYLTLSR